MFSAIKKAYFELIVDHEKDIHFWMFVTFIPTFIFLRLLVYVTVYGPLNIYISFRGYHIHHFTWGIFLLAIVGYMALTSKGKRLRRWIAAFYGIGLAVTFDEFGMWMRFDDNYWVRYSYDIILLLTIWFVNVVYFRRFWFRVIYHIFKIKKPLPPEI